MRHSTAVEADISEDTRAEIFAAEASMLRRRVWINGSIAVFALIVWADIDGRWGSPIFMLAGYMTVPTGLSLWQWWRHRSAGDSAVGLQRTAERQAALDEQVAIAERFHARGMPVTLTLAAVVAAVGVLQVALSGSLMASVDAAALVKTAVRSGQWWRLVSSMFLHLSVMHIASNVAVLVVLGRLLEGYTPRWRLPLVYAAAGVAGSIASYLFLSKTSAGASGAIMGLAGYLAVLSYLDPHAMPRSARLYVATLVGINLYLGAFGFAFIDNAAHLGGLLAGAAIAWWCVKRGDTNRLLLDALGIAAAVCLVIGASGTVYALRHHGRPAAKATPVTSVSTSLSGTRSSLSAIVKNDSDQTLEAYRLEVVSGRTIVETAWRDDCCFAAVSKAEPVAPRSFAAVQLSALEVRVTIGPPTVRITLAMFADGSYQGRTSEYELMMQQRQWVADDADYWLQAIAEDRGKPHKAWHESMIARMDARAHASTFGRPSASVLGIPKLASVIGNSPLDFDHNVDAQLAVITAVRDQLRARLRKR